LSGDLQRARGAFSNSIDSRYFIAFPTHQRALGAMINAVNSGCRLQALIAPAGLGKTTVLQRLIESLPQFRHWFYQFTLPCSTADFYRLALEEFGENSRHLRDDELRGRFAALVSHSANGSHGTLLILDEAQEYLSRALVTELLQILELCNEPVHIILCGQPRLLEMLQEAEAVPKTLELWQTLSPLTVDESIHYMTDRARLEGYPDALFSAETLLEIARDSGGAPFVINNLCWERLSAHRGDDRLLPPSIAPAESHFVTMPPELPATPSAVQNASAYSQTGTPPTEIASSFEALLQDVVSWRGTAGELLGALSIACGVEELLECLSSEQRELVERGISVDVRHRDGLPSLICLRRLPVDNTRDENVAPTSHEEPATIPRILPPQPVTAMERLRWRGLAVWILGLGTTAAVVTGVIRTAETRVLRANQITMPPTTVAARSEVTPASPVLQTSSSSPTNTPTLSGSVAEPHPNGPRTSEQQANVERLRRAALTRDPGLQYQAALELEQIDKVEAYKWLVLSHTAGYEKSLGEIQRLTPRLSVNEIGRVRHEVARAYLSGQGSHVDLVQAYRWLALARASGVPVDDELRSLSQRMSADQVATASKNAQTWLGRGMSEQPPAALRVAKPNQR
jgi:type II secretory pathway predicted ATPase ExeA